MGGCRSYWHSFKTVTFTISSDVTTHHHFPRDVSCWWGNTHADHSAIVWVFHWDPQDRCIGVRRRPASHTGLLQAGTSDGQNSDQELENVKKH